MSEKVEKSVVVFDLDGTLLDTLDDLTASVNAALQQSGYPLQSRQNVRRFLGNGIRQLMLKSVPEGIGEEAYERAFQDFRSYYLEHCLDATRPYEGVMPLLSALHQRGIKLAIVSNKLQPAVADLNQRFFREFVDVAIGESVGVRRKPAPDMVEAALKQLGATPEEAVYIGDSEVDLQTAKNSNLTCISVTWGFRDRDFLQECGASLLVDHPADIAELLNQPL